MDPLVRAGAAAPDFELPDLEGILHRRSSLLGRILLINFWSADCPHSVRADGQLLELKGEWGDRVAVWSVVCNRNERMEDLARAAAERRRWLRRPPSAVPSCGWRDEGGRPG